MSSLIILFGVMLFRDMPPEGITVSRTDGRTTVKFDFVGRDKKLTNGQLAWICEQTRIDFLDLKLSHVTERQLEAIFRSVDVRGVCLSMNRLDSKILPFVGTKEITEVRLVDSGVCPNDLRPLQLCRSIRVLTIGKKSDTLNSTQDKHTHKKPHKKPDTQNSTQNSTQTPRIRPAEFDPRIRPANGTGTAE